MLKLWTKKVLKLSVITWMLILMGCSSTPEVRYVEKIVNVPTPTPFQLIEPCDIPTRNGNKVKDYIVSERRLHNALVFCNTMIDIRNRNEQNIQTKLSEKAGKK